MFGYLIVICVFVIPSYTITVPPSWKDEQVFLPYYGVVDGSPSDTNVDTYYPLVAANSVLRDQVVQNDEVIKLFQKMNPKLTIVYPNVEKNPTHTASNTNNRIYAQPVTNQNINSYKTPIKLPLKNELISEDRFSKKPEPFKLETAYDESSVGVNHENPGWIPTKPIYPSEGQWAKKGVKHRPHITKNVFKPSPIDGEPSPGINFYNKHKNKLQAEYRHLPKKFKLEYPEESTTKDEDYEETTPEEFVPYRTYAQVRRTESEKHVPRKKSQPRLKESVKDSKTHTLYTEEGYEDSAYDHGDQEKNAESTENDNTKYTNKTENSVKISDGTEEAVTPPEEPISPLDYDESDDESSSEEDNSKEEDSIHEDVGKNLDNANSKNYSKDLPKESLINSENSKEVKDDRSGRESNSNDDVFIKFDSKKADTEYSEAELIDTVMDESRFGKKINQKKRIRRSAKIDSGSQMDRKYPYYNSKDVDPLSSLRYAENSDNIPKKIYGSMSFYEKADKVECPEMDDLDPVPARIKNAESNSVSKNGENQPTSRKLNNLGDQIDCLKSRYFGEDPFDNPLFKEENVQQPSSIFKQTNLEDAARFNSDTVPYQSSPAESRSSSVDTILNSANNNSSEEDLPQPLPYIIRRIYRQPPPRYIKRNKVYSKPHHPPQQKRRKIISQTPTSTHRPTAKSFERISEVHYKDEIKPSEQMNVFADIINNIKNSSKGIDVASSDVRPVIVKVHSNKNIPQWNRYRPRTSTSTPIKSEIAYEDYEQSNNNYYDRLSTTEQPVYYTSDNQISEEVPKRYRKRRPQVSIETGHVEEITEKIKVKKRRIRPQYTSGGNNLPDTFNPDTTGGFKPMLEETGAKETNHKAEYHEIEEPTINKFYYIGMRPPPEIPYVHPTYYLKSHIKRRRTKQPPRKRLTRSTRGYAEIQRGRQNLQEEPKGEEVAKQEEEEEEDDYVPHRARNFHYDEKTGKIIYDKKPNEAKEEEEEDEEEQQQEEIEYDFTEVEKPTHPPPPKKEPPRIWPTKYPDGPNYLDFIKKLKEDSTYIQILDPQSTEKPKEDAATTTIASNVTSSTELPEFLAILNRVRTDKSYTFIEDPTEKSNKTKATTPDNLEEIDELIDDASEEYIQEDIQNSPGAQGVLDNESQLQIFDASDATPNPRSYNPRTGVDTSKYTSIQRPTTRNKISSKYNSDTIRNDENAKIPTKSKEEQEDNEDALSSTTNLESFTIDIPTTSIPSTTPVSTTERTLETTKAKRVLLSRRRGTTTASSSKESTTRAALSRQRQRGRNRFSTTVTTTNVPIPEATRSRRNLQRRNYANFLLPRNHKVHYSEAQNVRNIKPTPRSITLNLLKQTDFIKSGVEGGDGSNLGRVENETKSKNSEVDKNQRLGNKNNGRIENETKSENFEVDKNQRLRDKNHGTGENETKSENLEVDKNQRPVDEGQYKKSETNVNTFGDIPEPQKDIDEEDKKKTKTDDVEVFEDYNTNQKHGGNYQYDKEQTETNGTNSESEDFDDTKIDANRKLDDVDAFKDYDKNQKHGGNYKYKKVQIKITRNYTPYSKETREVDDGSDGHSDFPQHSQSYYTDSKLPSYINNLETSRRDLGESDDFEENKNVSTENKNDFYDDTAVAQSISKKENVPNFIKDPSKRLYYYAPV